MDKKYWLCVRCGLDNGCFLISNQEPSGCAVSSIQVEECNWEEVDKEKFYLILSEER